MVGCLGAGLVDKVQQQRSHGYCRKGLIVAANAKLLASHLLLLPGPPCTALHPPPPAQQAPPPLTLTAIELAMDAVKTLWRIFERRTSSDDIVGVALCDATPTDVGGVEVWFVLMLLLCSMKTVSELHMLQGGMEKAYYYAREGVMLARKLQLAGW